MASFVLTRKIEQAQSLLTFHLFFSKRSPAESYSLICYDTNPAEDYAAEIKIEKARIQEICSLFRISKPTIHDWIKNGKLKRIKIRSTVYFLGRRSPSENEGLTVNLVKIEKGTIALIALSEVPGGFVIEK